MKHTESTIRSIIKASSWRITATITTVAISYFVTGDATISLQIGGIEMVLKYLIYFLHERAWNLTSFGRSSQQD